MLARLAIAALFVVSGALGVIDEVVFARLLGLHLGHAATAHATVVATFLAGLGMGYAWLGRGADQLRRPLLRYAGLELFIGLWCLAFPAMLDALVGRMPGGPAGRIGLAAALLLPPTIAMGGTLPALVRLVVGLRPKGQDGAAAGGRALAWLYALNSAGAVLGGLLAGFWMLERLGLRGSLQAAALGSVGVAAVAGLGGLRRDATAAVGAGDAEPPQRATSAIAEGRGVALACAVAALGGLASLMMQTLWFRVFGVVLGSSAYAFALVVALFIAGLTLGAAGAGQLLASGRPRPGWLVAALLASAALLLAISPLHERLPWWLAQLRFAVGDVSFATWQALQGALVGAVIVVPCAAMGLVLPLASRAAMGAERVASAGAQVFAWNTVGSVLGAAFGGTLLLPRLGLHGVLLSAVGITLVAAALAFAALPARRRWARHGAAAALALVALLALDPGPWDARLLGAGAFRRRPRPVPTWERWRGRLLREAVVFAADGPDASVAVLERGGERVLKVNGKPDASSRGDMLTQVASAWVPAAVAARAERVLVIGLGSGVTAGAARRFGAHTEVVEIAPAVIEAARHFAPWNGGVVNDPAVPLHVADARAWLAAERQGAGFDVIISEPSNPWVAGNGALFTREFFQLARARLRPGGVLAQWFHFYEMSDALLQLVFRTVTDSFPHVSLWTLFPGDLLLIASEAPQDLSLSGMQARLAPLLARVPEELAPQDLASVELRGARGLRSLLAVPPAEVRRRFAGGEPIHVDDHPLLELRAPRALFAGRRSTVVAEADTRRRWPGRDEAADVPLPELRALTRLHVRYPAAPPAFRHGLLAALAGKERDPAQLRQVVFTYGRQGPVDDARRARDRLMALDPHSPASLLAAARVDRRVGDDPRPRLRRCVALGDPGGRCAKGLRGWVHKQRTHSP